MASPFYNAIDIRVDGISQHASHPEFAANALSVTIDAMSRLKLGRVDKDTIRNMRITDGQTISGAQYPDGIHLTRNTIPGLMILRGEIRSYIERILEAYTLQTKLAFIEANNDDEAKHILAGSSDLKCNVQFNSIRKNGGFKYNSTDLDVVELAGILQQFGLPIEHYYGFGCYDANVFAEKGVRIMNMGYGGQFPHTKD